MKKYLLIYPLLFTALFSNAQNINFTKADPQPDFYDVYAGSFASGDIDGDGDTDLLIAGQSPSKRTGLYLNDGSGNFTEVENTPFVPTRAPVSIFEDFDGDGDLDLFLAGDGQTILTYTHIYLNDGNGNFTELANPSLPQFQFDGVDVADVDGDGDTDLMIAVKDKNNNFVTDIFLNNGSAIFTPSGSTLFTPVGFSEIQFLDAENDGDADVIISGEQEDESQHTALYLNDGSGNFTLDTKANFPALANSDMDVADSDNDGDMDVLFSGVSDDSEVQTLLYTNDGSGQFSALASTNLQKTFAGENVFSDLDQDGDLDLIVIGTQDGGLPNIYNIVYENQGNNVFIPVDTLGGEYIATGVAEDFNGDGLPDMVIQGFVDNTNVYWNTSVLISSIDQLIEAPSLRISPNPSSGDLSLNLAKEDSEFDLFIYSHDGRLAYQQSNLTGIKTELQLDLMEGFYMLLLKSDQATITKKLIIVK